jgi:pimeloyl-ACP methyl ester carboxylesterase
MNRGYARKVRRQHFLRGLVAVVMVLLLVILLGPLLVTVPPLTDTVAADTLAAPDGHYVNINALNVYYKAAGQGQPTFILLHGFGASLFSWREVMGPLSHIGQVIAYDRPAFGLTERPMTWSGTNPYSPEGNMDLLLGLMDQFGVQKAILVGNSAGGTLAMQFTLAHPDRVQALILVDPAVYSGGSPAWWVSLFGDSPQMQHLGPLMVRSIQTSGIQLLTTAWHDPSKITPAILDGYTQPLKVDNWDQALWDYTLASHDTGLTGHLKEFKLPILVITGDDDRIVPTAQSVQLSGELPGASLVVIPNAGHVPQEERPGDFMQAVEQFLVQLP